MSKRDRWLGFVALAAGIYVVAALWFTRSGSALTPDSTDYAEAARSLVRGEGATINRIMFHTGLFPRIRHPLEVHGILQTLLLSGLFAVRGPAASLVRVPSLVFLGGLFVTVYWVGRKQFGCLAGLVAVCVLFGRQDLLFWSVVGGDDIAFAAFSIAALSCFMTATGEPTLSRFALAGVFVGLAWLDKASGVALVPAFVIGLLVSRTARSATSWRSFLVVLAPSVLVFGLYVLRNVQAYGRPGSPYTAVEWIGRDHFPSYFALYERVPTVRDVLSRIGFSGLGRSILSQLSLLGRITIMDASLLAMVPAAVVLRRRNGAFAVFGIAFVVSLVFLTCVIHHVEYRYLSPLIALGALGIGGVAQELEQWVAARLPERAGALRIGVLCLLVAYTLFACVQRYRDLVEMGASMKRPDECGRTSFVISQVVPKDEAILTTNPWFVSWKTERPAVEVPTNGEDAILTVVRHYDVRWVMTGKPVVGAMNLAGAVASPRLATTLRPELVYFGQPCNLYKLHRTHE